jgi:Spy/CpxP family protein refolding chaperone
MQTETYTRLVGGLMGAVVMTIGLMAFTPQTGAAQDSTQAPSAGRWGGRGRGPGGIGGRMGGPMGGGALGAVMRDLTDAQREQVRAIHKRHAEEIGPLAERVRNARQALDEAVISGNSGNFRALALELGNAETELALAHAHVQSEVFGVLTAEQKQKIAERRKEMEARRAEMQQRRQAR